MMVTFSQVFTVSVLLLFTFSEIADLKRVQEPLDGQSVALWEVYAKQIMGAKNNFRTILWRLKKQDQKIKLCEERYLMGNRLTDDLYLGAGGRRIRCYINVQSDRLFLTVLKGSIRIDYHIYEADTSRRIEITDRMRVDIGHLELEFVKRRVT